MYITKKDTTIKLMGLEISIPAGSEVSPVKGGNGTYYVLCDTGMILRQYPYSILKYHLKYHYIYVPNEIVDECKNLTA